VLPVELDRSRPIYCDDCIAIVRNERKGKRGKGASTPRPHEGEPAERLPEEPSISLDALQRPHKQEQVNQEHTHEPPEEALDGPSLNLGALFEGQKIPTQAEIRPKRKESRTEEYEYTCSQCGMKFKAGVKLDPSRPLYCEQCLAKIRERRKSESTPRSAQAMGSSGDARLPDKKKRKRKKKSQPPIVSDQTQSNVVPEPVAPKSAKSINPPSSVPVPKPQEQTGMLHTGQTIRFD
jgi:DNA-directed RNA polymerase subunit RPC12/RpoP